MNRLNWEVLTKCKQCEHHVRIQKVDTVICNHAGSTIVAFIMPSNWVTGLDNGTLVVRCHKKDFIAGGNK